MVQNEGVRVVGGVFLGGWVQGLRCDLGNRVLGVSVRYS